MTLRAHTPEVAEMLTANGWFPGRDIGTRADELIARRIAYEDYPPLPVLPTATRFIRSYGELSFPYPGVPEMKLVVDPGSCWSGDNERIAQLGAGIGMALFPVGMEVAERGVWLVDAIGRFFFLHTTGYYFLGQNEYEAFETALRGDLLPDAEDYYLDAAPAVGATLLVGDVMVSQTNLTGSGEPRLHPVVRAFFDDVPRDAREPYLGRCAESALVSDQFWALDAERGDGRQTTFAEAIPHFAGAAMMSVKIRPAGDPEHGATIPPCKSCASLLDVLGIQIHEP
jgi:hypothetical protein